MKGGVFDAGLRRVLASALAVALAALSGLAPSALARDATVTSFDKTPIVTAFFPAAGLKGGQRAPTVLVGHGWGQSHESDENAKSEELFGSIGVGPLRRAGFNVLTWDARGFGQSGGVVEVDSKDFEGRDVQALLDYVAKQPEALLDGPGDPRVGMSGPSYGGGIQLVTGGIDSRVDALAPDIAWNTLISSLYKDETVKGGWSDVLFGAGVPTAGLQGLVGPSPQAGGLDPHVTDSYANATATGKIPPDDLRFFESRATAPLVARIRVPTLLMQGTADTLFTLHESIANYAILRRNGVPTKLVWFCGGHGACLTNPGAPGHLERAVIAWFRRYLLRDTGVSTGPRFEWVDDTGTWHAGADYPLASRPPLVGTGSGTLAFSPHETSGEAIAAGRAANAVNVPIAPPKGNVPIVGEPQLAITYSGTGTAPATSLYAQILDNASGLVLGNQVTPLPIVLDGKPHTLTRPLEAVAVAGRPDSSLSLQLLAGTNVYDFQRAGGAVTFSAVRVGLPTVDPTATPPGYPAPKPTGRPPRVALRIGAVTGRSRRHGRLFVVAVHAVNGTVRRVVVTVRTARGTLMGRSRARLVRGTLRIPVPLRHRLRRRHGYRIEARGIAAGGRHVRARRGARVP